MWLLLYILSWNAHRRKKYSVFQLESVWHFRVTFFSGLNGEVCGRFLLSWEGDYILPLGDKYLALHKWAIVHNLFGISELINKKQIFSVRDEQKPLCLFSLKGDLKDRAEMLNTGIRIRNVTRKDSGTYRCEISAKSEEGQRLGEATITLTVLGTKKLCHFDFL